MTSPTGLLSDIGVSIWLDDLSKDRLTTGSLAELMDTHHVVGVTSNPTIFAQAVSASTSYQDDIKAMKEAGKDAEDAVFEIMIGDVQGACDLLFPLYTQTGGQDGRVSLEVSPLLARDTEATIAQAKELWRRVARPNLMIKIPATLEGLPAISAVIAEGISVNVTLIFSLDRYRAVIDAYWKGLERALSNGVDVSTIFSVASFFVSRVDTAVDKTLDDIGSEQALRWRSQAAIANARLAYEVFERAHQLEAWHDLSSKGATIQRPLWASTGVKDPALPEDLYVTELAAPLTVNTMPEKTLRAVNKGQGVSEDAIRPAYAHAHEVMTALQNLGIDMASVTDELERDGVSKFVQSWHELLDTVQKAMDSE